MAPGSLGPLAAAAPRRGRAAGRGTSPQRSRSGGSVGRGGRGVVLPLKVARDANGGSSAHNEDRHASKQREADERTSGYADAQLLVSTAEEHDEDAIWAAAAAAAAAEESEIAGGEDLQATRQRETEERARTYAESKGQDFWLPEDNVAADNDKKDLDLDR